MAKHAPVKKERPPQPHLFPYLRFRDRFLGSGREVGRARAPFLIFLQLPLLLLLAPPIQSPPAPATAMAAAVVGSVHPASAVADYQMQQPVSTMPLQDVQM